SVSVTYTSTNAGGATARGPWRDTVYLDTGTGRVQVATVDVTADLAAGASIGRSVTFNITAVSEGDFHFVVKTDVNDQVYERAAENNNQTAAAATVNIAKPDLVVTQVTGPATANSGDIIHVAWQVTNNGNRASGQWTDRLILSRDGTTVDAVLATVTRNGPVEANASYNAFADVELPLGASGAYFFVVATNFNDGLSERDTTNNKNSASTNVTLSPYADLTVGNVTGPDLVVGDPGRIDVSWAVTNQGTGAGRTSTWTDRVILSENDVVGDGDDRIIGSFVHSGSLGASQSYTRTENIFLPNQLTGRFRLFVVADATNEVFENGLDGNNAASRANTVDVMPVLNADLVVTTVSTTGTPSSGQPLRVAWTVANQGPGTTDSDLWGDRVYLSTSPTGGTIAYELGTFSHLGRIGSGLSYDRAVDVVLPNGISGSYFLVVESAGGNTPFEFIYGNNNRRVVGLTVGLSNSPDLVVTDIVAPTQAVDGAFIDVSWTIRNDGLASADGTWTDTVMLKRLDDLAEPMITLGSVTYDRGLAPGITYTRTERFQLPQKKPGAYAIVVTTNSRAPKLYEHGAAAGNNTTQDGDVLVVGLRDRPDLQVSAVTVPDRVSAGGTAAISFTVINQGAVPAGPRWKDNVYLSLDAQLTADDILVGSFDN